MKEPIGRDLAQERPRHVFGPLAGATMPDNSSPSTATRMAQNSVFERFARPVRRERSAAPDHRLFRDPNRSRSQGGPLTDTGRSRRWRPNRVASQRSGLRPSRL
jgi:hypothetical protein